MIWRVKRVSSEFPDESPSSLVLVWSIRGVESLVDESSQMDKSIVTRSSMASRTILLCSRDSLVGGAPSEALLVGPGGRPVPSSSRIVDMRGLDLSPYGCTHLSRWRYGAECMMAHAGGRQRMLWEAQLALLDLGPFSRRGSVMTRLHRLAACASRMSMSI